MKAVKLFRDYYNFYYNFDSNSYDYWFSLKNDITKLLTILRKKIFYLHGLESTNESSKVDYMRSLGHHVHAEYMDYKNVLDLYAKTLNSIYDFKPDRLVGSSMGVYFA